MEIEEKNVIETKGLDLDEIQQMDEEKLKQFIEDSQSLEELVIIISYYHNLEQSFEKIKILLSSLKSISSLTMRFSFLKEYNNEQTLYLLKEFNQLTTLRIEFSKSVLCLDKDRLSFSHCLSLFTNLTSLDLNLGTQIYQEDNYFHLLDFYQSANNLQSLQLTLSLNKTSNTFYEVLNGIHFLKNLEIFKLYINSSYTFSSQLIDLLSVELCTQTNMRQFVICLGFLSTISQRDYGKIGNILHNFQKLEKLTIRSLNVNSKTQSELGFGFEKQLQQIPYLQKLYLKLKLQEHNALYLFETLQEMKTVEDISLMFIIKDSLFYKEELTILGSYFSKIKQLSELKVNFPYSQKISLGEAITFIASLRPLKKLQALYLDIQSSKVSVNPPPKDQNISMEDLVEVLSLLKKFEIYFYYGLNEKPNDCHSEKILYNAISECRNIEQMVIKFQSSSLLSRNITESRNSAYLKALVPQKQPEANEDLNLSLLKMMKNMENLLSLNLILRSYLVLSEDNLIQLIDSISQNKRLESLHIAYQPFAKTSHNLAMEALGSCLSRLSPLKNLILLFEGQFQMSNEGFLHITEGLSNLSQLGLLKLEFFGEDLQVKTVNQFFISINNFKNMKHLFLNISGQLFETEQEEKWFADYVTFPSSMVSLSIQIKLKYATFSNIENLFIQVSQLNKLKTLNLSTNVLNISCAESIRLIEYLKNLRQLQIITLNNTQFSLSLFNLQNLFTFIHSLESINYKMKFEEDKACRINSRRKHMKEKQSIMPYQQPTNQKEILSSQISDQISLKFQNDKLVSEVEDLSINLDSIRFMFSCLHSLTDLNLVITKANNNDQILNELFLQMRNLHAIQILSLKIEKENQISILGAEYLGQSLVQLSHLRELEISIVSQATNLFMKTDSFYQSIGELKSLTSLSISIVSPQRELTKLEVNYKELFRNVGFLTNLEVFKINLQDVHANQFEFQNLQETFQKLSKNLKRLTLYLKIVPLRLTDEKVLLKCLQPLKNLQCLNLNSQQKINSIKKCLRLIKINYILYFS